MSEKFTTYSAKGRLPLDNNLEDFSEGKEKILNEIKPKNIEKFQLSNSIVGEDKINKNNLDFDFNFDSGKTKLLEESKPENVGTINHENVKLSEKEKAIIYEKSLKLLNNKADLPLINNLNQNVKYLNHVKVFRNLSTMIFQKGNCKGKLQIFNNVFRRAGKFLTYERKKMNSRFLFTINGADYKLVISNLLNDKIYKFKLEYNGPYVIDAEEFQDRIYVGIEYDSSYQYIDLSKVESSAVQKNQISIEPNVCSAYVSTPYSLYVLGGMNKIGKAIPFCFKINKDGIFNQINSLNFPSHLITATFSYPKFLYTLGGYTPCFERLDISISVNSKWNLINVKNSTTRFCGCSLQIKEGEILLFGGGNLPSQEYVIFNIRKSSLLNTGKNFYKKDYHFSSKFRLFKNLFTSFDPSSSKVKIMISINSLETTTTHFDNSNN